MLKVLLASKGPHFEFICVTMPGLEPPLEKSGYRPAAVIVMERTSRLSIRNEWSIASISSYSI